MAWLWLAIVPLIVVGYYAVYLYKFEVGAPGGKTLWLGVAGVCFVAVALVQVMVNVLQLTPPRWEAVATAVGTVMQDPTILPRYLHFLLGSLAVAGTFLAVVAVERASRTSDPFFDDCWTALEGVSHFLCVAHNAGHDRPVSRLTLELQAEIDKYVASFLLLRRQCPQRFPAELHTLLFRCTRVDPALAAGHESLYRRAEPLCRAILRPARAAAARPVPARGRCLAR